MRAGVAEVGLVEDVDFDVAPYDWVFIEKAAIATSATNGTGVELVHLACHMAVVVIKGVRAVRR